MRFFVDTADVDQIRKANDMGVICGVTTNPSLIAKSGRQFDDVIKEITTLLIVPCFFIFFKMIFLISFNYKKLDFPCFFSKKYAMINVVLINNLFFISNILIFY